MATGELCILQSRLGEVANLDLPGARSLSSCDGIPKSGERPDILKICSHEYVLLSDSEIIHISALDPDHKMNPTEDDEEDSNVEAYSSSFVKLREILSKSAHNITTPAAASTQREHVVDVCFGSRHWVALTSHGRVFTSGSNHEGQLGLGHARPSSEIVNEVKKFNGETVVQIACGAFHTLALTEKGLVYGWGRNNEAQLTWPSLPSSSSQAASYGTMSSSLSSSSHESSLASSSHFGTSLSKAGATNGKGYFASLLHAHKSNSSSVPHETVKTAAAAAAAAATAGTLSIIKDLHGKDSNLPRLAPAILPQVPVFAPKFLSELSKAMSSASAKHASATLDDASARSTHRKTPFSLSAQQTVTPYMGGVQRALPSTVRYIACGPYFSAALTSAGQVLCWGSGPAPAIIATPTEIALPPPALGTDGGRKSRVRRIACGASHVIGLLENRDVVVYGLGCKGQLGLGETINRYVPAFVTVPGSSFFPNSSAPTPTTSTSMNARTNASVSGEHMPIDVFAGAYSSAVLLTNGHVYVFGSNSHGKLTPFTGTDAAKEEVLFRPRLVPLSQSHPFCTLTIGPRHSLAWIPTYIASTVPAILDASGGVALRLQGVGFYDPAPAHTIKVSFTVTIPSSPSPFSSTNGTISTGAPSIKRTLLDAVFDPSTGDIVIPSTPGVPAPRIETPSSSLSSSSSSSSCSSLVASSSQRLRARPHVQVAISLDGVRFSPPISVPLYCHPGYANARRGHALSSTAGSSSSLVAIRPDFGPNTRNTKITIVGDFDAAPYDRCFVRMRSVATQELISFPCNTAASTSSSSITTSLDATFDYETGSVSFIAPPLDIKYFVSAHGEDGDESPSTLHEAAVELSLDSGVTYRSLACGPFAFFRVVGVSAASTSPSSLDPSRVVDAEKIIPSRVTPSSSAAVLGGAFAPSFAAQASTVDATPIAVTASGSVPRHPCLELVSSLASLPLGGGDVAVQVRGIHVDANVFLVFHPSGYPTRELDVVVPASVEAENPQETVDSADGQVVTDVHNVTLKVSLPSLVRFGEVDLSVYVAIVSDDDCKIHQLDQLSSASSSSSSSLSSAGSLYAFGPVSSIDSSSPSFAAAHDYVISRSVPTGLVLPVEAPKLYSVTPSCGPVHGGTKLTVTGVNFYPDEKVRAMFQHLPGHSLATGSASAANTPLLSLYSPSVLPSPDAAASLLATYHAGVLLPSPQTIQHAGGIKAGASALPPSASPAASSGSAFAAPTASTSSSSSALASPSTSTASASSQFASPRLGSSGTNPSLPSLGRLSVGGGAVSSSAAATLSASSSSTSASSASSASGASATIGGKLAGRPNSQSGSDHPSVGASSALGGGGAAASASASASANGSDLALSLASLAGGAGHGAIDKVSRPCTFEATAAYVLVPPESRASASASGTRPDSSACSGMEGGLIPEASSTSSQGFIPEAMIPVPLAGGNVRSSSISTAAGTLTMSPAFMSSPAPSHRSSTSSSSTGAGAANPAGNNGSRPGSSGPLPVSLPMPMPIAGTPIHLSGPVSAGAGQVELLAPSAILSDPALSPLIPLPILTTNAPLATGMSGSASSPGLSSSARLSGSLPIQPQHSTPTNANVNVNANSSSARSSLVMQAGSVSAQGTATAGRPGSSSSASSVSSASSSSSMVMHQQQQQQQQLPQAPQQQSGVPLAGRYSVAVAFNPNENAYTSASSLFSFYNDPLAVQCYPDTLPLAGGQIITMTGKGFIYTDSVKVRLKLTLPEKGKDEVSQVVLEKERDRERERERERGAKESKKSSGRTHTGGKPTGASTAASVASTPMMSPSPSTAHLTAPAPASSSLSSSSSSFSGQDHSDPTSGAEDSSHGVSEEDAAAGGVGIDDADRVRLMVLPAFWRGFCSQDGMEGYSFGPAPVVSNAMIQSVPVPTPNGSGASAASAAAVFGGSGASSSSSSSTGSGSGGSGGSGGGSGSGVARTGTGRGKNANAAHAAAKDGGAPSVHPTKPALSLEALQSMYAFVVSALAKPLGLNPASISEVLNMLSQYSTAAFAGAGSGSGSASSTASSLASSSSASAAGSPLLVVPPGNQLPQSCEEQIYEAVLKFSSSKKLSAASLARKPAMNKNAASGTAGAGGSGAASKGRPGSQGGVGQAQTSPMTPATLFGTMVAQMLTAAIESGSAVELSDPVLQALLALTSAPLTPLQYSLLTCLQSRILPTPSAIFTMSLPPLDDDQMFLSFVCPPLPAFGPLRLDHLQAWAALTSTPLALANDMMQSTLQAISPFTQAWDMAPSHVKHPSQLLQEALATNMLANSEAFEAVESAATTSSSSSFSSSSSSSAGGKGQGGNKDKGDADKSGLVAVMAAQGPFGILAGSEVEIEIALDGQTFVSTGLKYVYEKVEKRPQKRGGPTGQPAGKGAGATTVGGGGMGGGMGGAGGSAGNSLGGNSLSMNSNNSGSSSGGNAASAYGSSGAGGSGSGSGSNTATSSGANQASASAASLANARRVMI